MVMFPAEFICVAVPFAVEVCSTLALISADFDFSPASPLENFTDPFTPPEVLLEVSLASSKFTLSCALKFTFPSLFNCAPSEVMLLPAAISVSPLREVILTAVEVLVLSFSCE